MPSSLSPAAPRFSGGEEVHVKVKDEAELVETAAQKEAELLSTADRLDFVLMFIGTIGAMGSLLQGLNADSADVQTAISEKAAYFVQHLTTFVAGIIVALTVGWDMALVMIGMLPLIAIAAAILTRVNLMMSARMGKALSAASSLAQQALSQIREEGKRQAVYTGIALGAVNGVMYCTYAVAFYYGAWRVSTGVYTGGQVLQVFFAAMMGGFSLGQAAPVLSNFSKGRSAGAQLWAIIDRVPQIDAEDEGGLQLEKVFGTLNLEHVAFAYPVRPDVQVFRDFSLHVQAGTTLALVGSSGSGKSTVVGLVVRFYDPQAGRVMLDGYDLRDLNLKWLRTHVGLVSQEPTLFATTISENIGMGRPGASAQEIQDAAASANAHKFISHLPEGYMTQVGERGLQLSGGQKQRIAIARAILKNPRVLMLDEATSALDTQSERIVQDALNKMIVGRTTVVVAHRLSTIQNADQIAVVQGGTVAELGSHKKLIKNPDGLYSALVRLQTNQSKQKEAGSNPVTAEKLKEDEDALEDGKAQNTGSPEEVSAISGAPEMENFPAGSSSQEEPLNLLAWRPSTDPGSKALDGKRTSGRLSNQLSAAFNIVDPSHDDAKRGSKDFTRDSRDLARGSNRASMQGKHGHKGDAEDQEAPPAEVAEADVSFGRLFALSRPEMPYFALGCVSSGVAGSVQPIFAFFIASFITVFFLPPNEILGEASFWSWMFFVLACGIFLGILVQQWSFGVMGNELNGRVRSMMLKNMLFQEIGWFDREENSSGVLATRLSTDSSYVRGAVGDSVGLITQNLFSLIIGYIIAFVFNWRMALLVTGALPFMIVGTVIYYKAITGFDSGSNKLFGAANQGVSDAFSSIRIVQAYNLQAQMVALYQSLVADANAKMKRQSLVTGLLMGYSQFSIYAVFGLIIWFGGLDIDQGRTDFEKMLKAFLALLMAAMGVAQAQINFPDVGKAKGAVQRIFPICDRKSKIDASIPTGATTTPSGATSLEGSVQVQDVAFAYPARPSVIVLRNFNLDIPAGQTVGLVGESGSGKVGAQSVVGGSGRCKVGRVYGRPDASMEEVEAAARATNAHHFIMAQPAGYDTEVGERGVQLSGGQKQRVAIARAVVKNPKILLLDEATSALDMHSEKVVQQALDVVMVGRTRVVVAHRLSTIRNAHKIALVHRGSILEQGTHEELLAKPGGGYAGLVKAQMGSAPV
ncbi:P-loop containing nucleoside triphosphate hydrolase protein [Dunaliella salina]|uniref:P-loop containing nucleoside triphosphate hydrolase protein n=1 Tax=Dunaliella salina TaxID=3046 RepID=A0ABQ7GIJ2_DUNSA|nr:P-loop containing nucleoside triphosphate hydrolase protein [Dunaliella salina]|eukprot:KAF5834437.1 P-loop containing nucleoside triphosphate hydrolase protein [Dunaliella salina]